MPEPSAPMTHEELLEVAETLSWGAAALTRASGVRQATVLRWFNGARQVPPHIAAHLRLLADFHRAHPFPPPPPFTGADDGGPQDR